MTAQQHHRQTRTESLLEAVVNVLIGYWINFAANFLVLPMFGMHPTLSQVFWIGVVFTVISVVRSYVIRRWAQDHLREAIYRVARLIHRK